jgi:8-oxo-dGTP diphosphatase
VRRRRAPSRGRWSLPGGRVEPAESAEQALAREVAEETGLVVEVGPFIGEVTRNGPDATTFRIRDYLASVVSGVEAAGDDAAELAWVPLAEVAGWPLSTGLAAALRKWKVL